MIRFNLLGSWSRVTLDRSDFLTATPADLRIRDFRKILLIKLSAIGDVVHTIPVLNKLRRRYPDAQIDWLVSSTIAEFLGPHPAITNVIEFIREDWAKPWRSSRPGLHSFRRFAALDLVIPIFFEHGGVRRGPILARHRRRKRL